VKMVEYETKIAKPAAEPVAPSGPEVYESRGLWKFRDASGRLRKFKSKEEAEKALKEND